MGEREGVMTCIFFSLQAQLEEAKTRADKFDDTFKSLSDQLDQLEKQAEGESTIMSEAEAVKEQLEKHNVRKRKREEEILL